MQKWKLKYLMIVIVIIETLSLIVNCLISSLSLMNDDIVDAIKAIFAIRWFVFRINIFNLYNY